MTQSKKNKPPEMGNANLFGVVLMVLQLGDICDFIFTDNSKIVNSRFSPNKSRAVKLNFFGTWHSFLKTFGIEKTWGYSGIL